MWSHETPTELGIELREIYYNGRLRDFGNYRGVSIFEDASQLVLMSELSAGWNHQTDFQIRCRTQFMYLRGPQSPCLLAL